MSALSILLVDDNPAHRSLTKRAITKAATGKPIVEASSIESARNLLFSNPAPSFSLLVLDLNLGDGRSTILMGEIRKSESHRNLPILVLSTSALPSDIRDSYDHGCNCYVSKSDDIAVFTREISAAVKFLLP